MNQKHASRSTVEGALPAGAWHARKVARATSDRERLSLACDALRAAFARGEGLIHPELLDKTLSQIMILTQRILNQVASNASSSGSGSGSRSGRRAN